MGTNDIKVGLTLTADGLKEAVALSAQLNTNLKNAAANAANIRVPVAVQAAQQGVVASNANRGGGGGSGGGGGGSGGSGGGGPGQASASSNMGRGVTGSTGAAGRDFAAQSQGLGGLVHVYATFAANIYAASAAFGALKEAMNTLHLQQGIEQLSAQSGKNLTSLAASLNMVTDGALTMKASLTSVANASAVGMTNSQILKMGEVAKKASQAMGWDMADAMDRLTKGIGKNRPQLLDELGIIVSANQVYQDYARQVGKTALTLTDYEKKQAFANAVLQQGLDKFGAIDIATNPFNKLEASAYNAMQSMLGLLDKGLGPVAKYLAESPTGLAIAMAGIAGILLKQAIPALSAWRENARKAADQAAASAAQIHTAFEAFDIQRKLNVAGPIAQAAREEANAHIAGVQTALAKALGNRSKLLQSAMSGTFDAAEGQKQIDTVTKATETYLAKLQEARKIAQSTDAAHLAAMDADIAKQKEKIGLLKYASNLAGMAIGPQTTERSAMDSAEARAAANPGWGTQGWQRQKNADRAQNASNRRATMANVAGNTQTMGIGGAFKELLDDVKHGAKSFDETTGAMTRTANTSRFLGKSINFLSGSLLILGSAAATALAAFSEVTMVLAVVGIAYSTFDAWASKATEQQNAFNTKITEGHSAVKTAGDAMEYLGEKSKDALGIVAITAMTNVLDGLTTAIEGQVDTFQKWRKAAELINGGIWDRLKDGFAGIFGKSNIQELGKSMGTELVAITNSLIFTPTLQKEFKEGIANLLHIDPNSSANDIGKALSSQLSKLDTAGADKLLKSVIDLAEKTKAADATSTAAAKAFQDELKAVDQEISTIANKLQFKDGIGKLGMLIETLGNKMTQAMQNPIKSFESLISMAKDPQVLAVLSMNGGPNLVKNISELDSLSNSMAVLVKYQAEVQAKRTALEESGRLGTAEGRASGRVSKYAIKEAAVLDTQLSGASAGIEALAKIIQERETTIFGPALATLNQAGATMIQTALKDAVAKAELAKSMTDLSFAQKAGLVTADRDAAIKLKELAFKETEVSASYKLQLAIIDNTQQLEEANAKVDLEKAKQTNSPVAQQRAQNILDAITITKARQGKITEEEKTAALAGRRPSEAVYNISNAKMLEQERAKAQKDAAVAEIGAQRYAVIKNAELEKFIQINKIEKDKLGLDHEQITLSQGILNLQQQYSSQFSETLNNQKASIELANAQYAHNIEAIALLDKRKILDMASRAAEIDFAKVKADINSKEYKKADEERTRVAEGLTRLEQETQLSNIKLSTAKAILEVNKQNAAIAAKGAQEQEALKFAQTMLGLSEQSANLKTEADQAALNNLIKYGSISAKNAAEEQANISTIKAQNDSMYQTAANQIQAEGERRAIRDKAAQDLNAASTEGPVTDARANEIEAAKSIALARVNAQEEERNKLIRSRLGLTTEQIASIKEEQTHLAIVNSLSEDLSAIFGKLGESMGGVVKAIDKVSLGYTKLGEANSKRLKEGKESGKVAQAEAKNQEATLDFQISATGELAGASKKMFNEKSTAYKVLDGIEKAAHVASLARTAVQLAETFGLISANTAAGVAKLFADGGWAGFVGAGALLALMASLGHGSGGGISAPSIADQTKAQNTGQKYDASGNLVDTGGGVLGDSSAKINSMEKSLSLIKSNSVDGLSYNSTMVDLLTSINTNIKSAATSLYSTPGVRSGALPGVVQGSSTSGGGLAGAAAGAAAGAGSMLALGFTYFLPMIGAAVGAVIGAFNKTSVNKTITDSGLELAGSFYDLIHSSNKVVSAFNVVQTETQKTAFGFIKYGHNTSDSRITESLAAIDPSAAAKLDSIFAYSGNLLTNLATKAGLTAEQITAGFMAVDISSVTHLKDLKGQDLIDETAALVGSTIDKAAQIVLQSYKKFQQNGEDLLQTAIRVDDTNTKVIAMLGSIGISSSGFSQDITEAIATAAGGLDSFINQTKKFAGDFLTTTERLAPVQSALTKELDRIGTEFNITGLSLMTSREQFAKTVAGLDVTTEAGQQAYVALLNVADAFAQVHAETRVVASAADLLKSKLQQQIDIYNLEGRTTQALTLQRKNELEQMDERLRAGQLYIYALQDEAALKTELKTAWDAESSALKSTISTLGSGVKTLDAYRLSLNMGAQSNLSPEEKYQQAKQQAQTVAALATSVIDTTKSKDQQALDQQAKTDAINQLPTVSSAFLDASKAIYSSSTLYNQDFSYIQDLINSTSATLGAQKTDAENQLEQLKTQVGALIDITNNTQTTNDILARLEIAQQNTNGVRAGATGSGLITGAVVTSPVPVETLFGTLTQKVIDLTAEVAGLRSDQHTQTQNIIVTNVTTQSATADAVVTGIENVFAGRRWDENLNPNQP